MKNSNPKAGFTILELLVAVTLMVILTGAVSYVFVTAKNVFVQADATIQVYQNARNAFDMMERELSVAEKTHDMQFFTDSVPGNKHFDPGEQLPGLGNRLDPPDDSYAYAMTIYGREYPDPGGAAFGPHRCDIIYFKSLTTVAGKERAALIIYKLDITSPGKPILKKYTLCKKIDASTSSYTYAEEPPDGTGQDLCLYVTDFKVEYYYDNPFDTRPPDFISVPVNTNQVFCYIGTRGQGTIKAGVFTASGYDRGDQTDKFSQIAARDKIYLYRRQETDIWDSSNDSDYVIDMIDTEGKITLVSGEPQVPTNISSVNFRAGYLPAALRVTLKIIDAKGIARRTMTRIIRTRTR
jgi:prepilin-type N-terminal cleavage/methylation domain-containing protein